MVETHAYVREHAEDRACAADKLFCKWYIEARSYARKNAGSRVWAAAKSFCEWQRRVPTGPTPVKTLIEAGPQRKHLILEILGISENVDNFFH